VSQGPPRVVFDPSVLIAGVVAPGGACAALVDLWLEGRFELVVSPHLLEELSQVLAGRRFRRYITLPGAERFCALIEARATSLPDVPAPPSVCADPDDDYLPALAASARAACLVSVDRHLRDAPGLRPAVVAPGRLLEGLRGRGQGPTVHLAYVRIRPTPGLELVAGGNPMGT
jgi:putative PIN family toxin of toxin-antitoxin system